MAQESTHVNNAFYDDLGPLWQSGSSHPVALLRAENRVRNPWILETVQKTFRTCDFLDVGCGGGLLTNYLAEQGLGKWVTSVEGIDLSASSLDQAKQTDRTGKVIYREANALCLPHRDAHFHAVSAMDILEHVEYPLDLIREAARVLQPGGLFFFHTFNRNFFSWLTAIKILEWRVRNTPKNLHIYRLFIRPAELRLLLTACDLEVVEMRGLKPVLLQRPLWKMLATGEVDPGFRFSFTRSLLTGYCGYARKRPSHSS